MVAIRVRATVEEDGEIRVRGLPLHKGQQAEVIVLASGDQEEAPDDAVMALLQHDPSWAWLREAGEDLYTEEDVR